MSAAVTSATGAALPPTRRAFDLFPNGKPGGLWMYAVGLSDGRVKFGIARNPRDRVCHHWHVAGGAVLWAHVFGPVQRVGHHCIAEKKTLAIATANGGGRVGKSEYFHGLTKVQAIGFGRAGIALSRSAA